MNRNEGCIDKLLENQQSPCLVGEKKKRRENFHTAEGDARGGNDTCLNDGILLPGEGLLQQPGFLHELSPGLDEEEPQQPSRNIQRRNDPGGQIELHHYESQQHPQNEAHEKSSNSQLLPPGRHHLPLE